MESWHDVRRSHTERCTRSWAGTPAWVTGMWTRPPPCSGPTAMCGAWMSACPLAPAWSSRWGSADVTRKPLAAYGQVRSAPVAGSSVSRCLEGESNGRVAATAACRCSTSLCYFPVCWYRLA